MACQPELIIICCRLQKLKDNIMELNISMNQIKTLPGNICNFKKLQYLDLGKNALDNLPDTLGSLSLLREIVISNNR